MEISVRQADTPSTESEDRARRFTRDAPSERPTDGAETVEEDLVTADQVVAEVNRIAEVVSTWPPELQVVSVSEDSRSA